MARETVAVGAATDPYQPAEGRYRLTRACLEELGRAASPFGIITRGPLIVRDVDVLQEAARRTKVTVTFSVPTLDRDIWRRTEPGTAPPQQRLRALTTLVDAGIEANVGMAPILPGLSDRAEQLGAVVRAARAAGATGIWANMLYLRPGTKEHFLERSRATGRSSSGATRSCTPPAPICPAAGGSGPRTGTGAAREHRVRDRRTRRLTPPREPEQLTLGV